MKKLNTSKITGKLLLLICIFSAVNLHGQDTLIVQPGLVNGKDAHSRSSEPNDNYGTSDIMVIRAETIGGSPFYSRAFIDMDISSIPSNAQITSATLNIYSDPADSRTHLFNNDIIMVNRVTSAWTQTGLTWNNEPMVSDSNAVSVAQLAGSKQDYSFNVTGIVKDMLKSASQSYGFRIKLKNETPHTSVYFASSENTNAAIRPKLTVIYTVPAAIAEDGNTINEATVYPNPFKESFTLNFEKSRLAASSIDLIIYDLSGRVVKYEKFTNAHKITVQREHLAKGFYLYEAKANGKLINTGEIIAE